MRAITIWQPRASLIAEGVKSIETRPKRSPWSSAIGETIAIHAAVRKPKFTDMKRVVADNLDAWNAWYAAGFVSADGDTDHAPLGAVVATCTLRDVVPMVPAWQNTPHVLDRFDGEGNTLTLHQADECGNYVRFENIEDQRPFGDFAPGRWALLLDNVVKCVPVPCRGYQGLWTLPPEVSENLMGWAA